MFWQSESASILLLVLGVYTAIIIGLYFWMIRGRTDYKLDIFSLRENPQIKRHLLIAGSLYLFISVLYLFAIPPGESPDEPGHLRCVEQVAIDNRIPIVDPKPEPDKIWWQNLKSGSICYHLPLYYLVAGQIYGGIAAVTETAVHFEFPPYNPGGPAPNLFQHLDKTTFLFIPEPVHLIGLRIVGIMLGFITLFTSYMLTRRIFPKIPLLALLATVLVAGWPQFVYLTRGISNDVLATAFGCIVLLLLLDSGNPFRLILAAFFSALTIFTKLTLFYVPVVVLLTLLIEWFLYKNERHQYQQVLLANLFVWGGMGLLLIMNPILKQHFLYSGSSFGAVSPEVYTLTYWLDVIRMGSASGWVYFGWMNLPGSFIHVKIWWGFLTIATMIGFVYAWRRTSTEKRPLLITLVLWMLGALFMFVRININRFQPQFRFVLTTIPFWVSFASGGIGWLLKNKEHRLQIIILCLIVFFASYNVWLVYSMIAPAYNWYLV